MTRPICPVCRVVAVRVLSDLGPRHRCPRCGRIASRYGWSVPYDAPSRSGRWSADSSPGPDATAREADDDIGTLTGGCSRRAW